MNARPQDAFDMLYIQVGFFVCSRVKLVCCAERDTQQPTTQAALVSTTQQT